MVQTNIVRNSDIGDAWIQQMMAANPPQFVIDPKTGQPNGNITSGLVRLSFCDLFEFRKPMANQPVDPNMRQTFGTAILFPPGADMRVFDQEWDRVARSDFAQYWNGAMWAGIDPPYRNQEEKVQYEGYTPGGKWMNVSSQYKPPVVDMNMNPIVDKSRVHAGMWAIVALNTYASGKSTPRKGPRFGIQTVMIVADDRSLEGGSADPRAMFQGVKVQPPTGPVSQSFGAAPVLTPPQFGAGAVQQLYGQQPPPPAYSPPAPYAPPAPAPAVLYPEVRDSATRAMMGLPPL